MWVRLLTLTVLMVNIIFSSAINAQTVTNSPKVGLRVALVIGNSSYPKAALENPCVGGSIPPRATKNLNSPLVGLFSFKVWRMRFR
jgi:hypothetical protein